MFGRSRTSLFCWHLHIFSVSASMKPGWFFFTCHMPCHAMSFCIFFEFFRDSPFSSDVWHVSLRKLWQAVWESYERGMLHEQVFLGGPVRLKCIQIYYFLCESFRIVQNCSPVSLCFLLLRTSECLRSCPLLMVRCAEDWLTRGGEGRGSILLTKHHVVQLRVLRPDSRASNGPMVQHFIGGLWYCRVLGAENGAFSAQFQFLLVFQCFSYCRTRLNSTRQH